jgi:hypothetical protein
MEYAEGVILGADSRTTTGKANVCWYQACEISIFFPC